MVGSRRNAAAHCRRTELPVQKFRCVRRGGYQPPGYFPHGEITSAQSADNAVPNICG